MVNIKILHRYDISPPANSVPATALPLTFLDIQWLLCCPMQCLFFYYFPQYPPSFAQTTLPLLVHSLSLCLRRFFPFAANLVLPLAPPQKPYILYSDGNSLSFIVAESTTNFTELVNDEACNTTLIHPLVPQLPLSRASNGARVGPLMAIQVTLFPNKGICIGVQYLHAMADGRSFNHFMKSWSSIHRSGGDPTCVESDDLSPFHDRGVIKDPNGHESILLKDWWSCVSPSPSPSPSKALLAIADEVRATFVLRKAHIDRLKAQILSQLKNDDLDSELDPIHFSTFVATCAFVWVCITKSKGEEHKCQDQPSPKTDGDKLCYFIFVVDCRDRLKYLIPSTYFGNYRDIYFPSEKRNTLLSKSEISHDARAIERRVKEIGTRGALRRAEEWIKDYKIANHGDIVTVIGSPRQKVYDTDFGWGRLRKSCMVHIDVSRTISLLESRDGDGGVEVGLALTKVGMEKFISLFENGLKSFMQL